METIREWMGKCRDSRKLILVIVAIALLLDNMLLTTVVPIIPQYLYTLSHPNETRKGDTEEASSAPTSTSEAITKISPIVRPPPEGKGPTIIYYGCPKSILEEKETAFHEKYNVVAEESQIIQSVPEPATEAIANNTESTSDLTAKGLNKKDLIEENVKVGIMFSSKAFVQLITNPFIGPLTHRIGYSIPMFAGFVIMFLSTMIFAFGNSFAVLFLARALQGVGSSCSSVSGMGMLAEKYPDDKERGNAMGLALGGLALGVLIGPPFGGFMSQFVGKMVPFLILAILALGDGLLQLLVLQPSVVKQDVVAPTLKELIQDPYIIIASGAIMFANMGIGMLEPSLPIWMMTTMGSSEWQQGVAFLPASISYLIGTNLFGPLGHLMGRWLASMLGLFIIGLCLCFIPAATSLEQLTGPMAGLGFAIGMVDSSMMPELGFLVDLRHSAVYGSVYSIGDVAFCLGFGIGPALAGSLVQEFGFQWMLYGIAFINFLYTPLMYLLKSPPTKAEEQKSLIYGEKSSVRYVSYQNEDDD